MGHYSVAMVAGTGRRLPLWVWFLLVQLVDVIWVGFVLTGVEEVSLDPTLPSNSLVLGNIPYTHSLLGTLVIASVAGMVVAAITRHGATAVLAGMAVASHWPLDLIVHRHDLTIAGGDHGYGFALWDHPVLAAGLEIALVLLAGWWMIRRSHAGRPMKALILVMVAGTVWFYFAPRIGTVTLTAVGALVTYLAITVLAARAEPSRVASVPT